ncbi:hypothetical protein C9J48_20415 [Photobacterium profundum]|uniref:Uncharacterized protein n=1 Tax=Photobacterium profundum 3TCK TaxID=314280 RepID=Q1Z4Y8_9GAMM|nr:hypothetical protein [Photobacterium profundum]EAS43483.1 hypothetical protein P3TCK_01464 [Photobacterium profundum 3TCK]PSV60263.1 hypothetical protein C9J48_20415 [Photobacterium profundum]
MIKQNIRYLERKMKKEIEKNPKSEIVEMYKKAIDKEKEELKYWNSVREKNKVNFIDISKEKK